MGQQQLILIVLCTIVVGIAIAVGLVLFSADAILAERDAIIQDITIILANARAYYARPSNMGGGGNSFMSYSIPARLSSNENGSYMRAVIDARTLTLTGYSANNVDNYMKATFTAADGKIDWIFYGEFDQ
jgi:hypothetical protein